VAEEPLVTNLTVSASKLWGELLPRLMGRVFHATYPSHAREIVASGAILPNKDRTRPSAYGLSYNSLFREMGAVSVFDLRAGESKQLDDNLMKCSPFQIASRESGVVFFVLTPATYPKLLPWTLWKEPENLPKMVVPYVEAGFPGSITLDLIEEILLVAVLPDPGPPSLFLAAHRALKAKDKAQ
jgi:hypothetical protein